MSIKPQYIFFYVSEDAVDKLLEQAPFRYDKPLRYQKSKQEAFIEYEHIIIKCHKAIGGIGDRFRGCKAWQVLVEDILYDKLTQDEIDYRLKPMMIYNILGGRIVSIYIPREY